MVSIFFYWEKLVINDLSNVPQREAATDEAVTNSAKSITNKRYRPCGLANARPLPSHSKLLYRRKREKPTKEDDAEKQSREISFSLIHLNSGPHPHHQRDHISLVITFTNSARNGYWVLFLVQLWAKVRFGCYDVDYLYICVCVRMFKFLVL